MKPFKNSGNFSSLIVCLTLTIAVSATLVSFKNFNAETELWNQLGLTQERGNETISNSFLGGYFSFYSARNLKNIATGNRVQVAKDLCAHTKAYVNSMEFKANYAAYRENHKPAPPSEMRSEKQLRDEYLKSMTDALENSKKAAESFTGDMRKTMDESVASIQQQIKEAEDPKSEMIGYMVMGEKASHDAQVVQYNEDLAKWTTDFPENPSRLVKARLQKLLDLTNGIDYNAQLQEKYGKKVFVNPDYQSKPGEWKLAFRAGKEVTETTRQFAKQWLTELK